MQITASETAIEEVKLNYIVANENNQGHGVIKLALTPTFQELSVSDTAVTEVDEDGQIFLANEVVYEETQNEAINENFFVKLNGIEETGFILFDDVILTVFLFLQSLWNIQTVIIPTRMCKL